MMGEVPLPEYERARGSLKSQSFLPWISSAMRPNEPKYATMIFPSEVGVEEAGLNEGCPDSSFLTGMGCVQRVFPSARLMQRTWSWFLDLSKEVKKMLLS